jgi:hypothetical protein
MTVSGRGAGGLPTGTALAGLGLAFLTAVSAVVLWSSFDELLSTPARFGAPWDVSVSRPLNAPEQAEQIAGELAGDPRIDSGALMMTGDVKIGEQLAPIMAYTAIEGIESVISPVITSGRMPETVDEIALGSVTMDELGLSLGDHVSVDSSGTGPAEPDISTMTVVGTTVYNDTFESTPGRGGLVVPEWMDREVLSALPTPYVVTLVPGTDVQQFKDDLLPVASRSLILDPTLQGAIRNVQRVRVVPYLLAALVVLLAIASLAHALVLSVRRQRRQLAVFKSLGFRRGQVRAAVAWHTTALLAVPAIVGIPLGIVVGRWIWRIVTDGLGVASPPSTPALWIVVIVFAVLVAANLVAAVPAWMAARVRTAEALRSE